MDSMSCRPCVDHSLDTLAMHGKAAPAGPRSCLGQCLAHPRLMCLHLLLTLHSPHAIDNHFSLCAVCSELIKQCTAVPRQRAHVLDWTGVQKAMSGSEDHAVRSQRTTGLPVKRKKQERRQGGYRVRRLARSRWAPVTLRAELCLLSQRSSASV